MPNSISLGNVFHGKFKRQQIIKRKLQKFFIKDRRLKIYFQHYSKHSKHLIESQNSSRSLMYINYKEMRYQLNNKMMVKVLNDTIILLTCKTTAKHFAIKSVLNADGLNSLLSDNFYKFTAAIVKNKN